MPRLSHSSLIAIVALAMTPGCAARPSRPRPAVQVVVAPQDENVLPDRWQQVAKPADAAKLTSIAAAWTQALDQARKSNAGLVNREGVLLSPSAALPRPAPTPGVYRCRVIKLGTTGAKGGAAFATFKPFFCYIEIEGGLLTFVKGTGSQRPAGRLWDDDAHRMVFLGTVTPEGTVSPPGYGEDSRFDQAGIVERIGDFRWRMVLSQPPGSSLLDVIELLPDMATAR